MARTIKVQMVLTKKPEQLDEHTWLGQRVVTAEFHVPLSANPTGLYFDHPIPVETTELHFTAPDIDAEIAAAQNKLLDELRAMNIDQIIDYLDEHADNQEDR